jgi:hypothetical protein
MDSLFHELGIDPPSVTGAPGETSIVLRGDAKIRCMLLRP